MAHLTRVCGCALCPARTLSNWLQVFLDAIGVPQDSVRRNSLRGIYDRVTLNAGVAAEEVELLLLDERYERVPLPCHTRYRYCQPNVQKSQSRQVQTSCVLGPW